jgi:hypothetical protein
VKSADIAGQWAKYVAAEPAATSAKE